MFKGLLSPDRLGLWASFPQHTARKTKKYDTERAAKKKNYKFNLKKKKKELSQGTENKAKYEKKNKWKSLPHKEVFQSKSTE